MKMLKVLTKVVKFYVIADSLAGLIALSDYYFANDGFATDHRKRNYVFGKFTPWYLNCANQNYRRMSKAFGLTIDDLKDEEDHLEILEVDDAKRMMA